MDSTTRLLLSDAMRNLIYATGTIQALLEGTNTDPVLSLSSAMTDSDRASQRLEVIDPIKLLGA